MYCSLSLSLSHQNDCFIKFIPREMLKVEVEYFIKNSRNYTFTLTRVFSLVEAANVNNRITCPIRIFTFEFPRFNNMYLMILKKRREWGGECDETLITDKNDECRFLFHIHVNKLSHYLNLVFPWFNSTQLFFVLLNRPRSPVLPHLLLRQ